MRTNILPWRDYFLNLAHFTAERSKDPSTQVGCVLVRDNRILATGYNGMPLGMHEETSDWERPQKYDRVLHAEANAIGDAARRGVSTNGSTAYTTHFPCLGCAKILIAAGVDMVVSQRMMAAGWDEEHKKAAYLFDRCGVNYEVVDQ